MRDISILEANVSKLMCCRNVEKFVRNCCVGGREGGKSLALCKMWEVVGFCVVGCGRQNPASRGHFVLWDAAKFAGHRLHLIFMVRQTATHGSQMPVCLIKLRAQNQSRRGTPLPLPCHVLVILGRLIIGPPKAVLIRTPQQLFLHATHASYSKISRT